MKELYGEGISVIIPTYQEVNNIKNLLHAISSLNLPPQHLEVIIVDDNSTDGTVELTQKLMTFYPWLKLIVRDGKRSLSHAVIDGLRQARFEILVSMDADLSHPPCIIPELAAALANPDVDFVIGSRYISGGNTSEQWPLARKLTSRLAAALARFVLSVSVKDPLSGFFALRKSRFMKADKLRPLGWKIALELMMKCRCKNIVEIPIYFSDRIHDESKLNWKVAIAYFRHIFRLLRYKYEF